MRGGLVGEVDLGGVVFGGIGFWGGLGCRRTLMVVGL
jgi:hypothetical protein